MGQVLGELGPPGNISPIVLIGLFLTRCNPITHLFLRDTTEEEEEPREDALICCHRYVDGRRDFCRGEESVCDVRVGAECRHVVAITICQTRVMRKRKIRSAHLMKFVRACIDRPSWSRTPIMCTKKSRIGIAKLFRGAMNSCGLSMLGSGLRRSQVTTLDQVLESMYVLTKLHNTTKWSRFRSGSVPYRRRD